MADVSSSEKLARSVGCSVAHLRNIRDRRKTASLPLIINIARVIKLRDISDLNAFVALGAE